MDINFVDELYTIPSLQDLCHSTLCVNYNNFDDDDKKHMQYWMKRIMAPKLESNKAFPITCVGVERLNLNIKFVNYVHKCDLYTPRLNGHAFECLKYLLDNDIVDEIWSNFLENKYEQIEHGRKLYSNHGFSNNVKWRKLLLELEFSAEWFKMFFEIMSDLFDKEDWAPILNCSFKRGRNKYQLKIMMTRKWYNVLKQYDLIQKITTYYYGTYNDMLLMLSGDVETNPGPVMSKLNVCNNNPSTLMRAQLFGSEGIEKIANFLHDKLPGYMETLLTHTNNMDEKVKEDINLLNDKIGKNVDKLGLIKTELCRTLLLTCIIFALLKLKLSKSAFALSVISILNTWNLPQHLITYIKTVVFKKQIVENDDEVEVAMEAQIGIQDISSFGPLILTIISFFGIGKLPPKSFIEEMAKKTNSISRGIQGGISISENISKMWEIIQAYLYRMIGPESSMDLKTKEEEIQEWINDIKFYTDIANRNKTQIDIEQAKKVEGLYRKGIDFKQWCFSVKAETRLIQLVDKMAQHAKKLYEYIDQNNTYGGGARTRPLAITLFGESQIGKTTCVMPLIQDIMIEAGFTKPEEVVQQVYARQAETEFWDGYHGQFCIIYDDAFSTIDDPNNPNIDMQESIRVNNIFPHHLHCATLQDKNTFNTSELVIYTANDINTPVKSLSYPDAFYNRIMTHCYEVRPKDAYAINRDLGGGTYKTYLDKTKLKTLLDTTGQPLTQEIYEFVKHVRVFKDGKWTIVEDPNSTPLNFEDFSALMCSEWRKNKITYRDQTSYLHDRFEERLKRKMGVPSGVSIKDPNLMKSQVNSEDEIPGCSKADRTLDVQNIILTKTLEGQNLEEIESWFLCNDQLSSIYIDYKYKLLNQVGKVKDKFILIKEQIANIFIHWKSKLNDLTQKLLNSKFVILKSIIGMIGIGLTMFGFWNLWKSFSAPKQENENIKLDELKVIKKDFTMNDFNINLKHLSYLKDNHLISDYQYNKLSAINMSMMINTENELELNAEAYSSPGSGKDKKNIRMRVEGYNSPGSGKDKKNHRMRVEHMMAEGVSDTSALEIGTGILRSNVYALAVNGSFYGNAIIVKGFNVLMPYHFITYMKMRKLNTNSILSLSRLSSSMTKHKDIIEFKLSDIVNEDFTFKKNMIRLKNDCGEYVDGVVFCLSEFAKMHNHRNIIKHFLPKANLNKLHGKMLGFLVSYLPEGNSLIRQLKDVSNMVIDDLEKTIYVEGNETTETVFYKQRCGYYYNSNTVDGDCGSPLLLKSNHETHKIIGMHVSGQPDTGYSVRITSEMLEQACAELVDSIGFRAECCLDIEDINLKTTQCDIPKGLFGEIGKAVIPLKSSSRSQIIPSRIHGQITQPISKPAHLSPFVNNNGELIDPAWKGLEKCGVNTMLIDPTPIRFAETSVYNVINHKHFNSLDMKDYCRVFSYEEAIRGNDDEFIRSICRTTSPGYPFNSDPKYASSKPGKTKWMGQNENFDFTSEDALFLRSLVTKLEHDCSLGIQSNVFCADTKKDERRPIAKVDEGKTRMFSACPMHYVVLFRQYYIGFASWVMHNRNWNEIAVGTNVYSQDWTIIAKKLQQKGDKVIAGDFSNFDGSLNISVLWAVFRIVNKWYMQHDKSEYNFKVRYMLWVHLVNSIHIHEDNIYQWTHSQPSGNPFTVILNSVYNCLIMRISYLQVVRDKFYGTPEFNKYYNMHTFCDNVSMIAYGDDNCLNISSKISDWFNQISISHAMEKLGHTYTDEGKTGEMLSFRNLDQIAFLKRKFKYDDSECRYLAPLDINVIYEMINWVRKNDVNQDDLLKTNIETALREMSLHSKLSYDKFILELENNDDVMNYIQPTIYEYEELRLMMSEFSPNDGFMA